jgi:hypothetical protein
VNRESIVQQKSLSKPNTGTPVLMQRRRANGYEPQTVPPIVTEVLQSPGLPLDKKTRDFFEPKFGYDFSKVRVHTDAKAAESAAAVNAEAYTVGQDVVFGEGRYSPEGQKGKSLIAHELTHVVQEGCFFNSFNQIELSSPNSNKECLAQDVAVHYDYPSCNKLTNKILQSSSSSNQGRNYLFRKESEEQENNLPKYLSWGLKGLGEPGNKIALLVNRSGAAIKAIAENPATFLKNLITGTYLGIQSFKDNIATHLKQGIFVWMSRAFNRAIAIPSEFDSKGVLGVVFDILGFGINTVKAVFSKSIGQDNTDFIWSVAKGETREAVLNLMQTAPVEKVSGTQGNNKADSKVATDTAVVDKAVYIVDQNAGKVVGLFSALKTDGIKGAWEY